MKQKRKSVFLFTALMLLSVNIFSGCASDGKSNLIGTWKWNINITKELNQLIEDSAGADELSIGAEIYLPMTLTFTEDSTYTFEVDSDAFASYCTDYISSVNEGLSEYIYSYYEDEGYDKETVDDYIESAFGMSMSEYMSELTSDLDLENSFSDASYEGTYTVSNDKILLDGTTSENGLTYSYNAEDNTITIENDPSDVLQLKEMMTNIDSDFDESSLYPAVLEAAEE